MLPEDMDAEDMEVDLDDAMDESLLAQKSTNRKLQGLVNVKKIVSSVKKAASSVKKAASTAVKAVGKAVKKVGKALGLRKSKCL